MPVRAHVAGLRGIKRKPLVLQKLEKSLSVGSAKRAGNCRLSMMNADDIAEYICAKGTSYTGEVLAMLVFWRFTWHRQLSERLNCLYTKIIRNTRMQLRVGRRLIISESGMIMGWAFRASLSARAWVHIPRSVQHLHAHCETHVIASDERKKKDCDRFIVYMLTTLQRKGRHVRRSS